MKQLVDKRDVLYALAFGAPVAMLTSAAGLHIFPGAWAWVAGASLGVWILASSGMVINQYALLDWERLIARHLGRLGVLGAAVLFCFFTYRAFFPSVSWALWVLLAIAVGALGLPWILVRSSFLPCVFFFSAPSRIGLMCLPASYDSAVCSHTFCLSCCCHCRAVSGETMLSAQGWRALEMRRGGPASRGRAELIPHAPDLCVGVVVWTGYVSGTAYL